MDGTVDGQAGNRLVAFSVLCLIASVAGGIVVLRLSQPPPVSVVTTAPPTTSPTQEAPVQLRANGLGRFTIGMPWSVAVSAGLRVISPDAICRLGRDDDTEATVVALGDEVVRISVLKPGVTTQRGVEVGDKREDAAVWYREADWSTDLVTIPDGKNELVIGLIDGEVAFMWAQRSGTVIGC